MKSLFIAFIALSIGQCATGQSHEKHPLSFARVKQKSETTQDLMFGYINAKGEEVIPPIYENLGEHSTATGWYEGLLAVRNGKYGFCDSTGKLVIPILYDEVGRFGEGRAIVLAGESLFIINAKNEKIHSLIIQPERNVLLGYFSSGMAWIITWNPNETTAAMYFLDKQGKIVFERTPLVKNIFYYTSGFSCGLLPVYAENAWGFMNTKGDTVIRPAFSEIEEVFHQNIARVRKNLKPLYINATGAIIGDSTWGIGKASEGLIPFFKSDTAQRGYINYDGLVVINPAYKKAGTFSGGLAAVSINGVYGFINKKNELVIPAAFADAEAFSEGLAAVRDSKTKMWGYIDNKGTVVIDFTLNRAGAFCGGIAKVKKDDETCYIYPDGKIVKFAGYESVDKFSYIK